MTQSLVTTIAAAAVLGATLWAGSRAVGPLPPLGAFLDPAHGVWAAATKSDLPGEASATIPGLTGTVDVRYDRRGVPHIFATTEEDAHRALGFVVARDRLFQLELQIRSAAGQVSEFVGARALPLDEGTRKIGMPWGADRIWAALDSASPGRRITDAYAEGVNAWIDALRPADYPVEYKLLGARPARWAPKNSVLLFVEMGRTLAYSRDEDQRLAARALIGDSAAATLFPEEALIQEPIQPDGTGQPHYNFQLLPPPGVPDTSQAAIAALRGGVRSALLLDVDEKPAMASNNWAVAPSRTRNGHALLAGDPHLRLTLPSIWYEAHLVVPGTLDVYGVTIPGAPGIVIGFNRDVAWSFTNTGADVMDFYTESVDDDARPSRYRVDGAWRPLELREEIYRGKRGEVLRVDTLRFTHRGPMTRERGRWVSMRWTVLEPSNQGLAFNEAARARTVREWHEAMSRGYFAPAQNMITADRAGTIAIRSTGHFPIRPAGANGLAIFDGSRSANDWNGFWPVERYPQSFAPTQGFVASANQQPIEPRQAFGHLGGDQAFEPWRALQINRLLRADSAMTVEEMRRLQTDPGSVRAELFVPYFLDAARTIAARGAGTPRLDSAAKWLGSWDMRYTPDNERAVLFEAALIQLANRTWDELVADSGRRVATPSASVLLSLLHDATSVWWDIRRTSGRIEDRDVVVSASLEAAYDSLTKRYGSSGGGGWRWGRVAPATIGHLLGLSGFSVRDVAVQGGRGTLNPSAGSGGFGSSWRMVVELGPELRAWATYPGGQSGNPASSRYADRIPLWQRGALEPLFIPRGADDMTAEKVGSMLTLTPRRTRP